MCAAAPCCGGAAQPSPGVQAFTWAWTWAWAWRLHALPPSSWSRRLEGQLCLEDHEVLQVSALQSICCPLPYAQAPSLQMVLDDIVTQFIEV